MTGIRREVYRSGRYLSVRYGAGLLLSVGGVLALTRLLGPAEYGLYAAAAGFHAVVFSLAQWGVGTYLVRHEGGDDAARYHHAASFLLVAGSAVVVAAALLLPLAETWTRLERLTGPALVLFAAVPVQLLGVGPMAKLERAMDFRSVAAVEFAGQAGFFVTALTLALAGEGVWAPVAGVWVQQTVQALGFSRRAAYAFRWSWSGPQARAMLSFGASYSVSVWLWQARRLANPLIVGRWLGAEAVAHVAVAAQIATHLGFLALAALRMSTAALARLQDEGRRTAAAVGEGMHLQALAVAPPLVAFGWVGERLVPAFFGAGWSPIMTVYPAVALGLLTASLFGLQSSALYVRRRIGAVSLYHLANVALLGGVAAVLVPRLGLAGYAWAELAALASFAVVHVFLTRAVGPVPGGGWAPAWVGFAGALLLPGHPAVGALLVAGVALLPATRQVMARAWRGVGWGGPAHGG